MKYRYLSDCHIHSEISYDGHDPVMMLCEHAARLGLHAVTVTDHIECNEVRTERDLDCVRRSLTDTQRAAIAFDHRLKVYRGIELGQATQNLSVAERILRDFEFDFVLGSLHNNAGEKDFYFLDYGSLNVEHLLTRYFREVLEMIELGWFDSLAHLTYPLRYIRGDNDIEVCYEVYESYIDSILHALIRKEKALEINSSGLRQRIGTTLPSGIVMKRFRELGGRYVTVGSDAHRWADVGSGVEEAMDILRRSGFDEFTVYAGRKPQLLPIA